MTKEIKPEYLEEYITLANAKFQMTEGQFVKFGGDDE